MPIIIWGLRVVYRTLGTGVFFCRRCGGDREYRHRAGRRFVTLFFIPLIPLTKTGEHVQCLTCKTRYVTEVLQLPTTRSCSWRCRAGCAPWSPPCSGRATRPARSPAGARSRPSPGAGARATTTPRSTPTSPAGRGRAPEIVAFGGQLQVEAREWYLAELIRIALADGPLTAAERAAAEHLAAALGMTQAQAIGVIALTEQNAGQS